MCDEMPWHPADRFIEAQAWWIASELCRRHANLRMAETVHDEVGTSLIVIDPDDINTQVIINRVAGIHVPFKSSISLRWPDIFQTVNPHDVVKDLEVELELTLRHVAPATTRVSIVYRTIAKLLQMLVDDRCSWMLRGDRIEDPPIFDSLPWAGDVSEFAGIEDSIMDWYMDSLDNPEDEINPLIANIWMLMRDLEPVAFFDLRGNVYTRRGEVDLIDAYAKGGRRTEILAADLLHLM